MDSRGAEAPNLQHVLRISRDCGRYSPINLRLSSFVAVREGGGCLAVKKRRTEAGEMASCGVKVDMSVVTVTGHLAQSPVWDLNCLKDLFPNTHGLSSSLVQS